MSVNLIAAVGRRGQIGRDGFLPWDRPGDLRMFHDMTVGGVAIVGHRTALSIPSLPRRIVEVFDRNDEPTGLLQSIELRFRGWPIWVAGGAATYRAFAPYVDGLRILSAIDYDSDPIYDDRHTFFPFDAFGMTWGGAGV